MSAKGCFLLMVLVTVVRTRALASQPLPLQALKEQLRLLDPNSKLLHVDYDQKDYYVDYMEGNPSEYDEPDLDDPGEDYSVTDNLSTDNPDTDNPDTDNPTTDNPVTDSPTTNNPDTDNPVTDKPTTNNPNTGSPVTDKPTTNNPNTGSPVTDNPTTEKPLTTTTIPTTTSPDYVEVNILGLGTARGKIMKSLLGRDFKAFMSIPYALPPTDERRFANPEPWSGAWPTLEGEDFYDASYLRPRCPQSSLILPVIAGREDCLHVSIYTPQMPSELGERQLPVMVWIHGGAYITGDASLYVPTKLMDKDLVVVVVQYRLGLFGFLAAGIKEAPGNMGLMDQIMALRWVQKYISNFGGDPDLVTVAGQSAGGASASWMQLTPLTGEIPENNNKKIAHRIIAESGSALELWTIDPDPVSSFQLAAETAGCWNDGQSTLKIVKCMRDSRSFENITQSGLGIYAADRMAGGLGFRGLCPVVQDELAAQGIKGLEIVIPRSPRDILANGSYLHVPYMSGSTRDDGSLVVGLAYKDYMFPNQLYINDTEFVRDDAIRTIINAFGIEDKNGAVSNTMRLAYLPNAVMGDWYSMVGGLTDMAGVMFLKSGLWEMVHMTYTPEDEDYKPSYFYSFEFEADDSLFPWMFIAMPDIPVPGGIGHADELPYLFHLPAILDERQMNMSRMLTTLWTNFAKYGDPTPDEVEFPDEEWKEDMPKWEPFTVDDLEFMVIDDDPRLLQDFSTRWNYHRDIGVGTTEGYSTSPEPETVAKAEYDSQVHKTEQFQLATGLLGGFCACTLFLAIVGFCKLRSRRKNAVV